MTTKILFVDDEPNVLAGYERQLRKRFPVETATSGAQGLEILKQRGPFGVVVSDMRMPLMDGAEFLAQVRSGWPDTVRLLLTGYADVRSAIDAVNNGGLFRFLTKPLSTEGLLSGLEAALEQYRLVVSERELLTKTLRGSVQLLGEVLALANPTAFGRATRLQDILRELADILPQVNAWEIEVSAVLSQLGYVAIPEEILSALDRGEDITVKDRQQLEAAPQIAINLLRRIPRLDPVLNILGALEMRFGSADNAESARKVIPFGARVLKVVRDFDLFVARGVPKPQAVEHLRSRLGFYDPEIITALRMLVERNANPDSLIVPVTDLSTDMLLADDLYTAAGVYLLRHGTPITEALSLRLLAMSSNGTIPARIRVNVRYRPEGRESLTGEQTNVRVGDLV